MRAGEILLAGHAGFLGRIHERMPDQHIEPLAQRLVKGGLEVIPDFFLPVGSDGGKALGKDQGMAVGVGGARRLFDKKAVIVANAMGPGPRPKFAHGGIVPAEAALGVNRHRVRTAAFRMDADAEFVRLIAKQAVMVINRQITKGLPVIKQKPVAFRAGIDDAPGQHRQPRQQIIAMPFLKFLAQRRRPVGQLNFPAIGVKIFQAATRQRAGIRDQRRDDFLPIILKGRRAIHVQRIPAPTFTAGGYIGVITNGVTET